MHRSSGRASASPSPRRMLSRRTAARYFALVIVAVALGARSAVAQVRRSKQTHERMERERERERGANSDSCCVPCFDGWMDEWMTAATTAGRSDLLGLGHFHRAVRGYHRRDRPVWSREQSGSGRQGARSCHHNRQQWSGCHFSGWPFLLDQACVHCKRGMVVFEEKSMIESSRSIDHAGCFWS